MLVSDGDDNDDDDGDDADDGDDDMLLMLRIRMSFRMRTQMSTMMTETLVTSCNDTNNARYDTIALQATTQDIMICRTEW